MKRPGTPGILLLAVWSLCCGITAMALAVPVPLPIQILAGGGGSEWQVIQNCAVTPGPRLCIADARLTQTGQGDAFDGSMTLLIGGVPFVAPATVDLTGTTVTAGPVTVAGLSVVMQYFADPNSPTLRTFVRLSNPTAAAIQTTVTLENNNGSDSGTQILASSSADSAFTPVDRWIITDDSPTAGDPTNTHVVFGPGQPPVVPVAVGTTVFPAAGSEGIRADYPLLIPPGVTLSLLFFNQIHATAAEATTSVALFDDPNQLSASGLLEGLSPTDIATTVNWALNPVFAVVQPGDIDGNGNVDGTDAQLLLQVLVGNQPPEAVHFSTAGDVNADNVISNLDAIMILGVRRGLLASPPRVADLSLTHNGNGTVTIAGNAGAVTGGSRVRLVNQTTGVTRAVTAATDGSFRLTLPAAIGDQVTIDVDGSPVRFRGVIPADPPPFFHTVSAAPDPAQANQVLTITFTASEALQTAPVVTVAGNAAVLHNVSNFNYTYTHLVRETDGEGPRPILIRGTDQGGNVGTGGGSVMLNVGPPRATIDFPGPLALSTASTLTVRGTAHDVSRITQVAVNGVQANTTDDFANWVQALNLPTGTQTLTVRTQDALGHSAPVAAVATVTVFQPALAGPAGLARESTGNVVVVDPYLQAVLRIDTNGALGVVSNATTGSGPQFLEPLSIAVETTGVTANSLAVADRRLGVIFRVNPSTGDRTILASASGACPYLRSPVGMAVEADGNLVVLDAAAQTGFTGGPVPAVLRVMPLTGVCVVLSDLLRGTGPGLIEPIGIAVRPTDGMILVTDRAYPAVLAIVHTGSGIGDRSVLSDPFTGLGPLFVDPAGIAADSNGHALLIDRRLRAIVQIDGNGNRAIASDDFTGTGAALANPLALALDASPALLVSDAGAAAVRRVDLASGGDRSDLFRGNLAIGPGPLLLKPTGIIVEPSTSNLVVVNVGLGTVVRIDTATSTRTVLSDCSSLALQQPLGIVMEPSGTLLVIDAEKRALIRVNPTTAACSIVADDDTGGGPLFGTPVALALDAAGQALVADTSFGDGSAILRVNPSNGNRSVLADPNTCPTLGQPQGIAVEPAGTLVVIDAAVAILPFAPAVLRVDPADGSCVIVSDATHGTGPDLLEPVGIAVEPGGTLAVVDTGLPAVVRIDGNGSGNRFILSSPLAGTGLPFLALSGIAADPNGTLLALEPILGAVMRIDPGLGQRVITSK